MSTLQELMDQRAALERQIAEVQAGERKGAIERVKELMATHGLTIDDLGGGRKKSVGDSARPKVAAKYINKATGETWSGRGLKPKWLSAAIAGGAKAEDFAV